MGGLHEGDSLDYSCDRINLIGLIEQFTAGRNRLVTAIPGLTLTRFDAPTHPTSYLLDASLCLIAQGKKGLMLGDERYCYDAQRFLFTAVDLPVISHILEATPAKPYLGIVLKLDPYALLQLMLEANIPLRESDAEKRGLAVGAVTPAMLSAFTRLVDLLNTPEDITVMAPLIVKEIFYRLLHSPQGGRLKRIVTTGTAGQRIVKAVDWIKLHYAKPLNVEALAKKMGMSPSSFHQHFREIVSMSPLQYQKRLRLCEARNLLLTENTDVTLAAGKVGYESPSQFSREYRRFFGAPPSEDIKALRQR